MSELISIIAEKWNNYLEEFSENQKDIYYFEEYVKLYETGDAKALCAVCQEEEKIMLFPFLRKAIDGWYDFETAYGYGGPISNTGDQSWNHAALNEMKALFEREKYICGFVRFHTLMNNAEMCKDNIEVLFDRNTVSIQTDRSEEEIWNNQIISKNRNMIRKAEKNELVYKAEYDFASMKEFMGLYNATMERLGAEDFYFFDEKYFASFTEQFKGKAFLGTIRKGEELICGAIFMYSGVYGHYHLEGSNHEYSKLAANNLLLWKTALELHDLGVKEFHLGGGYNSDPDNSLLKFKKSFSNNLKDFCIGKWIFNQEQYDKIKQKWAIENPDKVERFGRFLLCYRF